MNLPTLVVPQFSDAQYQLDKVFYSNYYKIKGFKDSDKGPVIADFGSFLGYSPFTFLSLGASKVYCIEINPSNYKTLLKNLEYFQDKVISWNLGVYTKNDIFDFPQIPDIENKTFYKLSEINLDKGRDSDYYSVPVFTLDWFLGNLIDDEIDILKLNIGYAELDILEQTEKFIQNIYNICLETSEDESRINRFLTTMKSKGFLDSRTFKSEEDGKTLILLSRTNCKDIFLV